MITALLLGIFLVLVSVFYLGRKWRQSVLRRYGIPGPSPDFITGNKWEIITNDVIRVYNDWLKKYGPVVGFYNGPHPIVLITDLTDIKNVFIKDFHLFVDRAKHTGGRHTNPESNIFEQNVFAVNGLRWKRMRSLISPTFSTGKMKRMYQSMRLPVQTLMERFDKLGDTTAVDVTKYFQTLTMDVIGRCAVGVQCDCQNDSDDPFFKSTQYMIDPPGKLIYWLIMFVAWLPSLEKAIFLVGALTGIFSHAAGFIQTLAEIIKRRKQEPKVQCNDALQIMLEHEVTESNAKEDSEEGSQLTVGSDQKQLTVGSDQKQKLREDEVLSNAYIFLIAGYETSSGALSLTTLLLATHPDVQARAQKEVDELLTRGEVPSYDQIMALSYLDQLIKESLRVYPPALTIVCRMSSQPYQLSCGITIPPDVQVQIPVYTIHHNPDIWPDPETFDPDRFSPERKSEILPGSFLPFGYGPRNCVGMRFGLTEVKLTVASMLQKYDILPGPGVRYPMEIKPTDFFLRPKDPIMVYLRKRTQFT